MKYAIILSILTSITLYTLSERSPHKIYQKQLDSFSQGNNHKFDHILIGDSILYALKDMSFLPNSANYSIEGLTASEFVRFDINRFIKSKSKYILIGINDLMRSRDFLFSSMEKIISSFAATSSNIYIFGMYPISENYNIKIKEIKEYNVFLKSLCDIPNCTFVQLDRKIDWKTMTTDGLHLNDSGKFKIKEIIKAL